MAQLCGKRKLTVEFLKPLLSWMEKPLLFQCLQCSTPLPVPKSQTPQAVTVTCPACNGLHRVTTDREQHSIRRLESIETHAKA